MKTLIKTIFISTTSIFVLSACTTPEGTLGKRTKSGALIGATVGALAGAIHGDNRKSILKGAIIGAGAGAGIGTILDKQEADLRKSLGSNGIMITNTGEKLIVTLPNAITFDTDSTYVRSGLDDSLQKLAQNLQQYPKSNINVIGHTDNVGNEGYNQNLSSRRAESVSNILLSSGVSQNRIRAFGRGENAPKTSNNTQSGRAENRRVEIIITPTL